VGKWIVKRRRSFSVLERFTKEKQLPTPARVSGGALRTAYYAHPEQVEVIDAKRINGTRGATSADD
jgi:hypothetical protein